MPGLLPAGGVKRPRRLDRRVVLKATAGVAAASLLGGAGRRAVAQTSGGTIAAEWVEAEQAGIAVASASEDGGWQSEPIAFQTDFPFFAIAPHWSGEEAPGAAVELSLSADGEGWTEPVWVVEAADGGPPERAGRRFGRLVPTGGASFVRYRAVDPAGAPTTLGGLTFSYFDASAGPTLAQVAQPALAPAPAPPPIISRASWGADESLRYGERGEIWPPAYQPVEHLLVHHTETANFEDPLLAIRSVYYYHAVVRGWGDIGYNYLVDFMGNVYEGRYGGENVVAGHAFQYNRGSAGIATLGRFFEAPMTPEMRTGLTWLAAWVGRGLDPFAAPPFHDIASLPTICAHRDVNPTTCPGDALYAELPGLRDAVGTVLAGTVDPAPADPGFLPGDRVVTAGEGGTLREGPRLASPMVARVAAGEPLTVSDGPATNDGHVWYLVQGASLSGWIAADLLVRAPAVAESGGAEEG